jgi:hypothetical protein
MMHAQAKPTATRAGILQGGLGFTSANGDYTQKRISGFTAYGTFDFYKNFGLEADIHDVSVITPQDIGETSYEAGLRYVYRHNRFEPYAKVLFGIASFKRQAGSYANPSSTNYAEYSYGAGLDLRLEHHINVRVIDFELQTWPTFPPNNLTPSLITVGVAYRLR